MASRLFFLKVGLMQGCVPLLAPQIRCFSDLPAWLDAHEEELRNKRVLMYCTGGVRCELASSFLSAKGEGFQEVYQLHGGILRYQEAYPDGGLFVGRNFVYDDRLAVGPAMRCCGVVGSCTSCRSPCDDYGARCRCSRCRALILVCERCQEQNAKLSHLVCTLCRERVTCAGTRPACRTGHKKLRILCLHGFAQSSKQFRGRTCALRKKLKDLAEFSFVDAPHVLQLSCQPDVDEQHDHQPTPQVDDQQDGDERSSAASVGSIEVDGSALKNFLQDTPGRSFLARAKRGVPASSTLDVNMQATSTGDVPCMNSLTLESKGHHVRSQPRRAWLVDGSSMDESNGMRSWKFVICKV